MRTIYTDGFNSAAHVALGAIGGSSFLLPFLFYQLVLQGRPNDVIDVAEYLSGWLLRNVMPVSATRAATSNVTGLSTSGGLAGDNVFY